jgi:lincosamide nucleotidyltransferase
VGRRCCPRRLCRLLRDSTVHRLTPGRALEQDLPAAGRARCTAGTAAAREEEMRTAARNSWRWNRDLAAEAAERWAVRVPSGPHERISGLLATDR